MKEIKNSRINSGYTGRKMSTFNHRNILFKNMYESLLAGKNVSYLTSKTSFEISCIFKKLFGVKVECEFKGLNNYKLILINNE